MSSARWVAGTIAVSLCGAVLAQEDGAQRVRLGESELYPSLRIDYVRDDNATRVDDSGDRIDSDAVVLRPRLVFRADKRQIVLRAEYEGEFSNSSEPAREWNNHRLAGGMDARFGIRGRAEAELAFVKSNEAPGQNLTAGREDLADTPVEFNDTRLRAAFTYGAAQARGNVLAGLRYDTRRYLNLAEVTDGRDYSQAEPYARFSYRLGGDTRLFTEVSFSDTTFDDDTRDYAGPGLFVGLTFAATGRLVGDVRIGVRDVDYSSSNGQDGAELFFAGGVDYAPSSITTFSLDLSRAVDNAAAFVASGEAFRSIDTRVDASWAREWSARFATTVFGGLNYRDVDCPDRDRTTTSAGLQGSLSIRRWLQVGAQFEASTRTSDDCSAAGDDARAANLDFDRQLVGVYVRVTL